VGLWKYQEPDQILNYTSPKWNII